MIGHNVTNGQWTGGMHHASGEWIGHCSDCHRECRWQEMNHTGGGAWVLRSVEGDDPHRRVCAGPTTSPNYARVERQGFEGLQRIVPWDGMGGAERAKIKDLGLR